MSVASVESRMARYGVQHTGEVVATEYHTGVDYANSMTLAEFAKAGGKITRIRLLHERGMFDVSYIHGTLPNGTVVPLNYNAAPMSHFIRRSRFTGWLIEWAKAEKVFGKSVDLLNPNVQAILW